MIYEYSNSSNQILMQIIRIPTRTGHSSTAVTDNECVSLLFGFFYPSSNANVDVLYESEVEKNDRIVIQLIPKSQDAIKHDEPHLELRKMCLVRVLSPSV